MYPKRTSIRRAIKLVTHWPHSARVLIRMGLQRGPMMNTLLAWEPRAPGHHREPWDGKDESKVFSLKDDPSFIATLKYFTLPDHAIIAVGNRRMAYADYKLQPKAPRPKKPVRPRTLVSQRPISPYITKPRALYGRLDLEVTSPQVKDRTAPGDPVADGHTVVRVDVSEKHKAMLGNQKIELYFFLNHRFLMEEGLPQLPYTFHYDFSNLREGEHLVTVNLLGEDYMMGTASRKVVVKGGANRRVTH